jgi:hypothetical protein
VPLGRSVLTTDGLALGGRGIWPQSPQCWQVGQWGFSDIAWNLSRPASVRVSRGLQRSRLIDPDQARRGFVPLLSSVTLFLTSSPGARIVLRYVATHSPESFAESRFCLSKGFLFFGESSNKLVPNLRGLSTNSHATY